MNKFKITTTFLMICLLLNMSACSSKPKNTNPKPEDQFNSVLPLIEEIEANLITTMAQIDLIPYYEKQIEAKKQKDDEKKQMELITRESSKEPMEEFTPTPITINDVLLSEILKQDAFKEEKQEEIPTDIVFLWHEINTKINKLHDKWNGLEAKLTTLNTPQTSITDFGNALNNLTVSSTEMKHMEALMNANQVTYYIPELLKGSKDESLPAIYYIKYYLRQIVLNAASTDYVKANDNLQAIKVHEETLLYKLVEKKAKDHADKLKVSITDLENVISTKDLNLIKIKASIVTKNIISVKDTLQTK